jgi:hypothetical protein
MADRKSYLPGPTQRPALLLLCCMPYIASTWAADIATSLPQTTCVGWNKVATITTRGKTEDEGFRGTVTQTLDTQDWSGASHYLNSRTAQSISVTKAWLRRRGWCQPNLESTEIVALPDNTDGGVAETVWRVTPSNRVAAILRFDRDTGLLRSSEIRMQFNVSIQHYEDWEDIGAARSVHVQLEELLP